MAMTFDGFGFTTSPDIGDWSWGLQLHSFGFAAHEQAVQRAKSVKTEGDRIVYDWGDGLDEWYVNHRHGLEHGYTLHKRPKLSRNPIERGPLQFKLGIRGKLTPVVLDNGQDVQFLDSTGASVLTYSGLCVFDADGRSVSANFELVDQYLCLNINEAEARYPLTIDPVVQMAYIKASNTGVGDGFGLAVSVSGDTVVIAAPLEDSAATGVNGDQSDNSATASGAVYVFVRNGDIWSQQAYLKASNTGSQGFLGDFFGSSVCISGNTLVVAASGEQSNATGVDGDQSNDDLNRAGAAYVFVRNGTTWSQQAYLKASNTDEEDNFARCVSVFGDTVVIGAVGEDSAAIGINGDSNNNDSIDSGAAYVFVRNDATWSQQAYLKASNADPGDQFGASVSVFEDTIAVGASTESSSATGANGDQNDNAAPGSGAAYIFVRNDGTWSQQSYLKASNTGEFDEFGRTVSLWQDRVLVSAQGEDSCGTGVNSSPNEDCPDSGAAYVFARAGESWSEEAYLKASNTEPTDAFGVSASLSGNIAVVGALGEDGNSTGPNRGNQNNNGKPGSGAAYAFRRSATDWQQIAYLKASNSGSSDQFGDGVAVSGGVVVVGARFENGSATGVNGPNSNGMHSSGAAYVFDLGADEPFFYCAPKTSSAGCMAAIGVSAPAQNPISGANDYSVVCQSVQGLKSGLLLVSLSGQAALPFSGGTLCVKPPTKRGPLQNSSGTDQSSCGGSYGQLVNDGNLIPLGLDAGTGISAWYQWWYRDSANGPGTLGTALSNAVRLDFE